MFSFNTTRGNSTARYQVGSHKGEPFLEGTDTSTGRVVGRWGGPQQLTTWLLTPHPDRLEAGTEYISHFKLIQAVHHLGTIQKAITTQQFPTGMMRQVIKLTQFIKPSSPNNTVQEQVQKNTAVWMDKNMQILQEHYTDLITRLTDIDAGRLALKVAANWAHRRYGNRLHQDTLTRTESLLFQTESP